jgi:Holliday junction resolvase
VIRRSAQRRDANEPEIVNALEAIGAAVQRLPGDGMPDLLVGFRGVLYLIEIKLPFGPRGGIVGHSELNDAQVRWWRAWKGPAPVIARSVEQALEAIGAEVRPA